MPKRILLLQGPVGPFFLRLAQELRANGHAVYKINLNGGDRLFYGRRDTMDYAGTLDDWAAFLESKLRSLRIDRIYLFGDCRQYHVVAKSVAARLGIGLFVFEEGYLRPNYVTLEANGVNGHSSVPRLASHYRKKARVAASDEADPGTSFFHAAFYAIVYYCACRLGARRFPHYRHHRPLNIVSEGWAWIRAGARKLKYRVTERRTARTFLGGDAPPFFLVPLQVHQDTQVLVHSPFPSIEAFVAGVIQSFARHAPDAALLVVKHHPLDRGYRDYAALIRQQAQALGIGHRVKYLHDWSLPCLLRHCLGVVTINSTVGLSALHHGRPVKALGRSIYDMPGLTHQGALDEFWTTPGEVDHELFLRFRAWLLRNIQVTGSFYRRSSRRGSPTGMKWPARIVESHSLAADERLRCNPAQAPVVNV